MKFLKRYPLIPSALFALGIYLALLPFGSVKASLLDFFKPEPAPKTEVIDLEAFSRIPVLRGGRVKPLDSVARNTLLVLRNKRTALDENGSKISAINWLAKVLLEPSEADKLKTFVIDHDQVLGLLNRKLAKDGKYYSYNEIEPFLSEIDQSARESGKLEREKRDSFDQNIIDLYRSVLLYRKLKHTLSPPAPPPDTKMVKDLDIGDLFYDESKDKDRTAEYSRFRSLTQELSKKPEVIRIGSDDFAKVVFLLDHYSRSNLWSEFFPIPPEADDPKKRWRKVGESLVGEEPMDSEQKVNLDPNKFASMLQDLVRTEREPLKQKVNFILTNEKLNPTALFAAQYAEAIRLRTEVDPILSYYEQLRLSYLNQDPKSFNAAVSSIRALCEQRAPDQVSKIGFEKTYNAYEPFYRCSIAYIIIFLSACLSWFCLTINTSRFNANHSKSFKNVAYHLTLIILIAHTFGLVGRMYIEGRPPVTNLYSSALFIGWGAVLLCWFTEKYLRLGIASSMGAMVGFGSLVIAHNLSLDSSLNPTGDTMEMMRAVLDSNFWLATHVVTVTIGYSTTFLAGFLGIAYIFYYFIHQIFVSENKTNRFSELLSSSRKQLEKTLGSMIFGITCFSLFFSLVGTVLGGIWADQSWGRFWGWDAKENGALLIVIWNAIILHARWAGIAKIRGIACLAIFGNVVTAWSWFGTNMLGVGLHSYGFMDKAFNPLMTFIVSQMVFIGIAYFVSPACSLFKKSSVS